MIYVMSDIHGNIERFESIMKQINLQPDDTLYILGDVIDRYPYGIKLLRQFMRTPNIKMLLGNHEYMMLTAIGHCANAAEEKKNTDYRSQRIWYRNGGEITHSYLKHLRIEHRAEVFQFIRKLPVNIEIELNGTKFKLVHGSPVENFSTAYWYSHDYNDQNEFAVWERWKPGCPIPEGYTLIFGHTPTVHFQDQYPFCIWKSDNAIGIDCGSGFSKGRLACLRLDDMTEFYSEV